MTVGQKKLFKIPIRALILLKLNELMRFHRKGINVRNIDYYIDMKIELIHENRW